MLHCKKVYNMNKKPLIIPTILYLAKTLEHLYGINIFEGHEKLIDVITRFLLSLYIFGNVIFIINLILVLPKEKVTEREDTKEHIAYFFLIIVLLLNST